MYTSLLVVVVARASVSECVCVGGGGARARTRVRRLPAKPIKMSGPPSVLAKRIAK